MNTKAEQYVIENLKKLSDAEYRLFHLKLMPTVEPDTVLGVRVPLIRNFAKEFLRTDMCREFIENLPHTFYEENNLHTALLYNITDFNKLMGYIEAFLPHINNWATCDMPLPKAFKTHKRELLPYIKKWLRSKHIYTVRFAVKVLMDLFLDEDFSSKYLEWVANIKSNEYYINMMCAWYFATALYKRPLETMPFIEAKCLPKFTHNKAISKSIESNRIPSAAKAYLKTLRIG